MLLLLFIIGIRCSRALTKGSFGLIKLLFSADFHPFCLHIIRLYNGMAYSIHNILAPNARRLGTTRFLTHVALLWIATFLVNPVFQMRWD